MRFLKPALVLLILLAAAIGYRTALLAQKPTFTSRVDLVNFGVTVTDKKGNFLTDLKETDFELLEDGKKQTLTYFSGSLSESSAGPLHLGVLFDISGSMEADISMSKTAAIKFLNTLNDAQDMTLVDFDEGVRVTRYGQDDFARLVERVRSRKADGYTALYDAIGVFLGGASQVDGRKILVLYTDGGDNTSNTSYSDLMTLLKSSDVTVYAVGFIQHQGSAAQDLRMRLQQLTDVTGGQSYFPSALKELDSVYEKIRQEIRAQYSLGYVSTNTAQDGSWRKVEIKVLRDGGKNIKLRTRKGYYALYRKAEK